MTTNKTITFSFTRDAFSKPQATHITQGGNRLTGPAADQAKKVINTVLEKFHANKKTENATVYEEIEKSDTFTASIELPADETSLKVKVAYSNYTAGYFTLPLGKETADSLKLKDLVQSSPSARPLNRPPKSILKPSPAPATTCINPAAVRPTSLTQPTPRPVNPIRVVRTTAPSSPTHGLLYLLFAAIGRWLISLFSSSDTASSDNTPTDTTPLVVQRTKPVVSTHQAKPIAGIRPLYNGNNICFINAVFQGLMNAPAKMRTDLIAAHEAKIQKEREQLGNIDALIAVAESQLEGIRASIQELEKPYSWFSILPDAEYDRQIAELQTKLREISSLRAQKGRIELSIKASTILNQALRTYNNPSDNFVWLKELRGFIPGSMGTWTQEDACQLLDAIFEPLNSALLPLFGEENQLIPYEPKPDEADRLEEELKIKTGVSPLSADRLKKRVEPNPIVRMEIPEEPIALQALLEQKFTMQDDVPAELFSFTNNEKRGWYKAIKGRLVLETKNKKAPEYIPLQLKRFKSDQSKIATAITLPEDNKLTVIINDQPVVFEIQTLVLHTGNSIAGGHYISYVRKGDEWFVADDYAPVKALGKTLPASAANQAYMLFLKKVS